jgi:long-chain acyl-CoA synthetase
MLVYTAAGSKPKGVILTHGNMVAAIDAMSSMNPGLPRLPMVHVLPLTHVFGLLMLLCANRWGFTSVLLRQFDPFKTLSAVAAHGAGYLPLVPTMMLYLLGVPRERFNTESLYRVSSGGAALPEELRLRFEKAFCCRVDQGYGMTESVGTISSYGEQEPYRPGSAGRPAPGVEVLILDEGGHPIPPRGVGEICVRGANITPGYWRDPVASRQAFSGRWLHTGDIGYQDEGGYLYVTGRKKELIIKGGENISPREIEDALCQHPAVGEAAVIGVPDSVFGEEICAVISLKPGREASEDEIRLHVSRRLSKFKVPGHVIFQAALPKTASGVVEKRQIYEQFAGGTLAA